MRKLFLSAILTEFTQQAKLISLGIVTEDDNTFYAEFNDVELPNVSLRFAKYDTVSSSSNNNMEIKDSPKEVAYYITTWLKNLTNRTYTKVSHSLYEIYSDYSIYTMVAFNQLWNGALKVPNLIHPISQDLCSYLSFLEIDPNIDRKEFSGLDIEVENALSSARIIKKCFERIFEK